MTVSVYTPYVTATINGEQIDPENVLGARVESSFADPITKGYVKCISNPGVSQGDEVTITMGSGSNNQTRFHGTIYERDWLNSGPNFEVIARGPMYQVQRYRNGNPRGLTLTDLTGGPATDEEIARAVLSICGVDFDSGNIGGTGIVRGSLAAVAYTWRFGETALEYLQRLAKSSLGYAVVETVGDHTGQVFRVQLFARVEGDSDMTFTEGIDIFEGAHLQESSFEEYSAWSVNGFDFGDGFGPVNAAFPDPTPNGVQVYAYQSEMIERALDSDPGGGVSAETVLGYIRDESDGPMRHLSGFQTPRDELIGPGQIHTINSDMLGGSMQLSVRGVTIEADADWFTQTMDYVGSA